MKVFQTALLGCLSCSVLLADTGYEAWLRYSPLDAVTAVRYRRALPAVIVIEGSSAVLDSAREEMIRGVRGMLGRTLRIERAVGAEPALIIGRTAAQIPEDGYSIRTAGRNIVIAAANDRGALYGTFALLRKLALHEPIGALNLAESPAARVRWINHWDNLDGTIERGYGGRSIFFDADNVRTDLTRVRDYARLLASLGINACSINNVNANPRVISTPFLPQVARVAEVFRAWGVKLVLSVDFGSPKRVGNMKTFDPANPAVAAWWKTKIDEIYQTVPDLAGVVMKADSEGRVGPSAYGRTHAEAANTVARALKPHGGLMFYRAFVYDHNLDWRNLKNDRARAAYDNFHPLDGQFDDNVVIQIKHGPIDFQVREPASPLFGALEKTNQAVELQITQEYFGQARHTVFLVPMWKDALDTDLHARGAGTPVKALVSGKTFNRPTGGFVGVSNVGLDDNWLGNHLSQANLYGFGRLAWNPDLTSQRIVDEWTRMTFGHDPKVVDLVNSIQLNSWRTFENYTGPLGLQTLTAIAGNHYGPAVESSERNGWGQWHRSDAQGSGMDRTSATGTGFIGQFRPPVARLYESLAACPDDLVLFMHHVPYTHVLNSGKTVIQTIYDLHYTGATAVRDWVRLWKTLDGRVDQQRYDEVLAQFEYQADHAEEWRDAINGWFLKTTGISDKQGRAGHFANRIEAEAHALEGYAVVGVTPWEAASGEKAIECKSGLCSAVHEFKGAAGWYTIRVRYFDQIDGVSGYKLLVGDQLIGEWTAADRFPTRRIDSSSSTVRTFQGVALRPGDRVRIEGKPDAKETAALDYIEIVPERE